MSRPPLDPPDVARMLDAREPQAAADTAVQIASGLFAADAASLWWRGEGSVRLIARQPALDRVLLAGFDAMPELLEIGEVGAITTLDRSSAPPGVSKWLAEHELQTMMAMPMRLDDVGEWVFTLSWSGEPPEDLDEDAVARFADRVEVVLLRAMERKWREESALGLADNVAQALVVGRALFEMGDLEAGNAALDRAFDHTQDIMSRLRHEDPNGRMVRIYPASLSTDDAVGATDEESDTA